MCIKSNHKQLFCNFLVNQNASSSNYCSTISLWQLVFICTLCTESEGTCGCVRLPYATSFVVVETSSNTFDIVRNQKKRATIASFACKYMWCGCVGFYIFRPGVNICLPCCDECYILLHRRYKIWGVFFKRAEYFHQCQSRKFLIGIQISRNLLNEAPTPICTMMCTVSVFTTIIKFS